MTGELVVRRGKPADAPRLLELSLDAIRCSAAGLYTAEELAAWAATRTLAGHQRMIAETVLLVAELEGRIAGFANLDLATAVVDQLFVEPQSGGRRVALTLLSALELDAVRAGLRQVESHASKRAVGVFERSGYQRVETEHVALQGEVLERYLVRKSFA